MILSLLPRFLPFKASHDSIISGHPPPINQLFIHALTHSIHYIQSKVSLFRLLVSIHGAAVIENVDEG